MEIALVLLIMFLATLCRSALGFGDALIAMPLLLLVVSPLLAAPMVALVSIFISVAIILQSRENVFSREVLHILIPSIIGIPLGVYFLKGSAEWLVKLVLAVMLIVFSVYKLYSNNGFKLRTEKSSWLFGIVSGLLGGAYNTNGPPIIIYGTLRSWPPERFRLILQSIFLPTNIVIVSTHAYAGLWTGEMFTLLGWSLLSIIPAYILGAWLNKKIPVQKFTRIVYYALIVIGLLLIYNTI